MKIVNLEIIFKRMRKKNLKAIEEVYIKKRNEFKINGFNLKERYVLKKYTFYVYSRKYRDLLIYDDVIRDSIFFFFFRT